MKVMQECLKQNGKYLALTSTPRDNRYSSTSTIQPSFEELAALSTEFRTRTATLVL